MYIMECVRMENLMKNRTVNNPKQEISVFFFNFSFAFISRRLPHLIYSIYRNWMNSPLCVMLFVLVREEEGVLQVRDVNGK